MRTDLPKVVFEDCLMFLEVGFAQDFISELFPVNKRMITPSCCKFVYFPIYCSMSNYGGPDYYSLTGASVEVIIAFLGPYLF